MTVSVLPGDTNQRTIPGEALASCLGVSLATSPSAADRAYQIARRLLPIPQDAEDVAQEALLQVFASRGRWKPTARFTIWLYRIVVNLSLKQLRKAKSAPAFALAALPPDEESPAGRESQAPPADEPERVLLKEEVYVRYPHRSSGWLHPLRGRLVGQEFPGFCLQDGNDMDGPDVGLVLLTLLRRQQALGASVGEHVETHLELRIGS